MHPRDRHDLCNIGWWVGKSSVTRLQPALLRKERFVDLGTSVRSHHNALASRLCVPAARQRRIEGMSLCPMGHSTGLTSGPLLTALHEHRWQHMD